MKLYDLALPMQERLAILDEEDTQTILFLADAVLLELEMRADERVGCTGAVEIVLAGLVYVKGEPKHE